MRNKLFFRIALLICLLITASLGCQLVDNIRDTIQMIGTGRAIVTDIGGLATQFMPAGIGETAMAFVTDVDTSALMGTAQAAITEKAPVIGETMQSVATEIYTSPENAPEDIPIMDGDLSAFIGSAQSVSYFINAELQEVASFYQREMPLKGWQESSSNSGSSENVIELEYEKEDRKAKVILTTIPFVGQTTVVISIENR